MISHDASITSDLREECTPIYLSVNHCLGHRTCMISEARGHLHAIASVEFLGIGKTLPSGHRVHLKVLVSARSSTFLVINNPTPYAAIAMRSSTKLSKYSKFYNVEILHDERRVAPIIHANKCGDLPVFPNGLSDHDHITILFTNAVSKAKANKVLAGSSSASEKRT